MQECIQNKEIKLYMKYLGWKVILRKRNDHLMLKGKCMKIKVFKYCFGWNIYLTKERQMLALVLGKGKCKLF